MKLPIKGGPHSTVRRKGSYEGRTETIGSRVASMSIPNKADLAERFSAKVNKRGRLMPGMKTRCYEWTGFRTARGYGKFKLNGKSEWAHRVAFFVEHGRWPEPQALHRCDNPSCVRTSHLREGTQADNMHDMKEKGRARAPRGEARVNAKLRRSAVNRIRSAYNKSSVSQQSLATEFKVSQSQISKIIRRKDWNHVEF